MIQTKEAIIQTILSHKDALRSYAIESIGLFGSYKKETHNNDSDIDLLIEFLPQKKTFKNYTGAYLFLKDSSITNIDCITPESLSPYIGPHILNQVEYVSISN